MLQKISNKCHSFEKMYHGLYKNIKQNCFFEQQISIFEWFQKDHVTLKTGVMAAKNSAFPTQD